MKAMLNLRFLLTFGLVLFAVLPGFCQQPAPKVYALVGFHKVKEGHTMQEARALEDEWKKIHQSRVDKGLLVSWNMWSKSVSSNPNPDEYDYITVQQVTNLDNLAGYPEEIRIKAIGSKEKYEDLRKRTGAASKIVKMEIVENLEGLYAEGFALKQNLLMVADFMKVKSGKDAEYLALEKDFKKLHQERITMSAISGWQLWGLMYPHSTEKGFDYITVNIVPNLARLADTRYLEAFNKAMPGQDVQKLLDRVNQTRETVRQEIYSLQSFTAPATSPVQASR